jgi:hypothetical protein
MGRVLRFRSGNELLEELCQQAVQVTERPPAGVEERRRFVHYVIRRYGRLERYDKDQWALAFLERLLPGFVEKGTA